MGKTRHHGRTGIVLRQHSFDTRMVYARLDANRRATETIELFYTDDLIKLEETHHDH